MLTLKAVLGVAVGIGIASTSGLNAQVGAAVGLESMIPSGSGVAEAIGRIVPVGVTVAAEATTTVAEATNWAVLVGEIGRVAVTSARVVGLGRVVLVRVGVKVGMADGVVDISGQGVLLSSTKAMEVGGGVAEPGGASSPGT
jgi:hypothetical protein